MKHYVVGFLFNEKDEVLLLKKIKPAWQFNKWNGVGGNIEPGETPGEAMRREFIEETRIGDYLGWEHKATIIGIFGTLFVFATRSSKKLFEKMPARNDVEELFHWFPKNSLPSNMIYNLPWVVRFCDEQPIEFPVMVQEPYHPKETD